MPESPVLLEDSDYLFLWILGSVKYIHYVRFESLFMWIGENLPRLVLGKLWRLGSCHEPAQLHVWVNIESPGNVELSTQRWVSLEPGSSLFCTSTSTSSSTKDTNEVFVTVLQNISTVENIILWKCAYTVKTLYTGCKLHQHKQNPMDRELFFNYDLIRFSFWFSCVNITLLQNLKKKCYHFGWNVSCNRTKLLGYMKSC